MPTTLEISELCSRRASSGKRDVGALGLGRRVAAAEVLRRWQGGVLLPLRAGHLVSNFEPLAAGGTLVGDPLLSRAVLGRVHSLPRSVHTARRGAGVGFAHLPLLARVAGGALLPAARLHARLGELGLYVRAAGLVRLAIRHTSARTPPLTTIL